MVKKLQSLKIGIVIAINKFESPSFLSKFIFVEGNPCGLTGESNHLHARQVNILFLN